MKGFKVLLLLLILPFCVSAQSFLSTQGKDIVDESGNPYILRGMGLGGWMLQEGYMLQTAGFASPQWKIRETIEELIGVEETDAFYEGWFANHVTRRDIDSLAAWGFNSVRLPMHYNLFTLPIEDEPIQGENTWLEKGFVMTDSLIKWCRDNDMYVILDLHAAPGGQGYDEAISDYNPSKPSLWESQDNRDKTASLWKKIAERYVNEPVVAGYDLLNETNWDLPGGTLLKTMHKQITDSIRLVDNNHIIFIEGNWFANDFTGLTPPWDDNMVYSPHKYWSVNDQASIQWVLDIREEHNVPLYLGESGENSNVWFRDAIRLLEDNNIGWAWWPMKKVESIAGPTTVPKSEEYQFLLDYWSGNGPAPTTQYAIDALMGLVEGLKIENTTIHKDVIDAMFRQVYSDETIPYAANSVPGVVYASDFDMGVVGEAYFDLDLANYAVTTGSFTPWNAGWAYRNDGVDIEKIDDNVNSNGYGVGFISPEEWIQYELDIQQEGVYDIVVRTAGTSEGIMHFGMDGAELTPGIVVQPTGDYNVWQSTTVSNVVLTQSDSKFRFYCDASGYNIASFEFIRQSSLSEIAAEYVSAYTSGESEILVSFNKPFNSSTINSNLFLLTSNGSSLGISDISFSGPNNRSVKITVNELIDPEASLLLSYTGNTLEAVDGTKLQTFSNKAVRNDLTRIHDIPGKIEAEDYSDQSGIQLENTTDVGGGLNVGYLDQGDYIEYQVNVAETNTYMVTYRTAAQSATGRLALQKIESNGFATTLHTVSFQPTGDWQIWASTEKQVYLEEGEQTLRILIQSSQFNLNWFEFTPPTRIRDDINKLVDIYPNPSNGIYNLKFESINGRTDLKVVNLKGQTIYSQRNISNEERIDLQHIPSGLYTFRLILGDGRQIVKKVLKSD